MATQFQIYNGALRHLGQSRLLTLTDDIEARYALDDLWTNGLINYVLEQGYWYFAMRAAQFDADPNVAPNYGLAQGFVKPTDWIRTAGMCSDPYYNVPVTSFADEAGFWYSDTTPLYVKYISNDVDYGANLGKWPESFVEFVQAHMAWKICPRITGADQKVAALEKTRKTLLIDARSKAAMNESAAFPPAGTWTRARFGRSQSYLDRGNQSQLIG